MSNIILDRTFYKEVFRIILPVTAQRLITVGVSLMDNIMVGKLQETVLSGCTAATQLHLLFNYTCLGLSLGAGVLLARFWGSKNLDQVNKTITLTYRMGFLISLLFTIITAIFPQQLLSFFSSESDVIAEGVKYLKASLPCYVLLCFSVITTAHLRNIEQVRLPLLVSIFAFFVNVFFNWVLIFGNLGMPAMGIVGAAISTTISRFFEAAALMLFINKGREIGYRMKYVISLPCRKLLPTFLRITIPVMINDTLLGLGNTITVAIIGQINKIYMSAYSITAVVQRLTNSFTTGLYQAAGIVVGNTLGTGNRALAKKQGITLIILAGVIGTVCAGFILLLSPAIISQYNIMEVTAEIAGEFMRGVAVAVILMSVSTVMLKGVLRSGGETTYLLIVDLVFLWFLCVPLGYLAGHVWHWSPFFLFLSLRIDHLFKSLVCVGRLKGDKWVVPLSLQDNAKK